MKPISTSRSTFAFSASLLLLVLFTALPAYAQLELDQGGNIGVGQLPDTQWKFNVEGSNSAVLRALYTGASSHHAAVLGWAKPAAGKGIGGEFHGGLMGLRVYAVEEGSLEATGIFARASGSDTNTGFYAQTTGGTQARSLHAYTTGGSTRSEGVFAEVQGSQDNYGVRTAVYATQDEATAYGVYGYASRTSNSGVAYGVYGTVAGPYSAMKYAGYFMGDVQVTGTFTNASDARFKEAVEALDGERVLDRVLALEPKQYRYKLDAVGQRMGFSDGERFGFIAQELEQVFPELVSEQMHTLPAVEAPSEPWDGAGPSPEPVIEQAEEEVAYKAVNYVDLIPVLVGAIQEQQSFLTAQQAEIAALKQALGKLGVTVE